MKRTTDKNQKPTWRKNTPGNCYPFPNKRARKVKPKEEIQATAEELGSFLKHFELVEPGSGIYKHKVKSATEVEAEEVELAAIPKKDIYSVERVKKGEFNVLSSSGKVMNEEKLTKDAAEKLKASFEEETIED